MVIKRDYQKSNNPNWKGGKIKILCLNCKKIFWEWNGNMTRGRGKFCSSKCYWGFLKGKKHSKEHNIKIGIAHKRERHWNWKGGKCFSRAGYVLIHSPEHPFCDNKGYVREHRLVMEAHLGRHLLPTEVVHHINNKHSDNCIENLILFSSTSEHRKFHSGHKKFHKAGDGWPK